MALMSPMTRMALDDMQSTLERVSAMLASGDLVVADPEKAAALSSAVMYATSRPLYLEDDDALAPAIAGLEPGFYPITYVDRKVFVDPDLITAKFLDHEGGDVGIESHYDLRHLITEAARTPLLLAQAATVLDALSNPVLAPLRAAIGSALNTYAATNLAGTSVGEALPDTGSVREHSNRAQFFRVFQATRTQAELDAQVAAANDVDATADWLEHQS